MRTVLILDSSEVFRTEMEKELQKDFRVFSFSVPDEALQFLLRHQPDGLIVNMMLHGTDGLTFLEQLPAPRPGAVLARSPSFSRYTLQRLTDLGVSFPVLSTCSVQNVGHRMRDIMQTAGTETVPDRQAAIQTLLQTLCVPHSSGYEDIRIGIPIFAQDPEQSMTKDFYPAVAELRDRPNWKQSESAIRDAKKKAYKACGRAVWDAHFPGRSKCPTNRDFFAQLVELLAE